MPKLWSLVLGLTLHNRPVLAEIFRAGILAVPRGQSEAAAAIVLDRGQVLRLILLPQAARLDRGPTGLVPRFARGAKPSTAWRSTGRGWGSR